tara:strand:- start:596 stop:787 length:192 start_codon:yes stop_codon:yes gene_type:complete
MPINDRITEYRDMKDNYEAYFKNIKNRLEKLENRLEKLENIVDKINPNTNPAWLAKYAKELLK